MPSLIKHSKKWLLLCSGWSFAGCFQETQNVSFIVCDIKQNSCVKYLHDQHVRALFPVMCMYVKDDRVLRRNTLLTKCECKRWQYTNSKQKLLRNSASSQLIDCRQGKMIHRKSVTKLQKPLWSITLKSVMEIYTWNHFCSTRFLLISKILGYPGDVKLFFSKPKVLGVCLPYILLCKLRFMLHSPSIIKFYVDPKWGSPARRKNCADSRVTSKQLNSTI